MDKREIAILKKKYNDVLGRYNKAEEYYKGNGNKYTEYQESELCKITLELSGLIQMIEAKQGSKVESKKILNGFY